jgi:PiT family inorganic phosphate transporter
MRTVAGGLLPLSPVASWVVVVAQSLVLFLFASMALEHLLASHGLPTLSLVPVPSSHAVVGAVIGIGLLQGGRAIRWSVLGRISVGWVATPLLVAGICFVSLFFVQDVFNQQVYRVVHFRISEPLIEKLAATGVDETDALKGLVGEDFQSERALMRAIGERTDLGYQARYRISEMERIEPVRISAEGLRGLRDKAELSTGQLAARDAVDGLTFEYPCELADVLGDAEPDWRFMARITVNKAHNQALQQQLDQAVSVFSIRPASEATAAGVECSCAGAQVSCVPDRPTAAPGAA